MQNQINSSLSKIGMILFFLWYPIYLIWKYFDIDQISNLRESIVEYKYRILLVIIVHLLIVLWKTIKIKKPKFLELFFLWWKPIVTVAMFIYPFFSDFQQRFGRISENNVTDFYAIFLPIFIMFILMSLRNTKDPDFLSEMKDTLSIKPKTDHKINSLVVKFSKSIILLGYSFLFMLFAWWIDVTNKVSSEYKDVFIIYPLAFFCFFFGLTLLFNTIFGNKPDIKADNKSSAKINKLNTSKIKSNRQKNLEENIKISFK